MPTGEQLYQKYRYDLEILHNIFNCRDTEVVLLSKADVFNHYLNIR
jgi:hypothetical protein